MGSVTGFLGREKKFGKIEIKFQIDYHQKFVPNMLDISEMLGKSHLISSNNLSQLKKFYKNETFSSLSLRFDRFAFFKE